MRLESEDQGHDKESYEHQCWLERTGKPKVRRAKATKEQSLYLLQLVEPLADLEAVRAAGNLTTLPSKHRGTDDFGQPSDFCIVDANAKDNILRSLAGSWVQPTFIKYSQVQTDLLSSSPYPTLGIDVTMPQYRPDSGHDPSLLPAQHQYPVCYFFYGILADPTVLTRVLGLASNPEYIPARVTGGLVKTWAGKYRALVDGPSDAVIQGRAFLVENQEWETSLRCFETDEYEVVRCNIDMGDIVVRGLTFRYTGDALAEA